MNIKSVYYLFKLTLPVATAYIPLGLALEVFMVSSEIRWFFAPFCALIIFAGSIEFLLVIFVLFKLPITNVSWMKLTVNFRHIFMGFIFRLRH